jgi:hypothetical protein
MAPQIPLGKTATRLEAGRGVPRTPLIAKDCRIFTVPFPENAVRLLETGIPIAELKKAMFIGRSFALLLIGFVLIWHSCVSTHAQAAPARKEFPPGAVHQSQDLPPGRLRTQIERLPAGARNRAVAWLGNFHFTEHDLATLQVDAAGGIFYADDFQLAPVAPAASEPVVAAAALPVSPFPANLIFHSKPGAPNVIFLNFAGETVQNTAWNTSISRSVISAVAYSSDADRTTFSDAEQLSIRRIWQRVAEDYSAFNVDVTTERPATFNIRTAEAVITRNTDASGQPNPSSTAGGVSYVGAFATSTYASYRPAWIYDNNLAGEESYIGEATAHEIGHNMGLSHDGTTEPQDYYRGHGSGDTSWGPIMGASYGRNVTQWSKGEYYLANNTQDDLATIAGKLTYRTDDHGNTMSAATPLVIGGGGVIASSTPETDPLNLSLANKGILERNTDVDWFSFPSGAGPINLTINPWITPGALTKGGNLDLYVELYDASGRLLLTNNAAALTFATIQTNLTEGIYYLAIRNTAAGNPFSSTPTGYTSYGGIGQYFINGAVIPSGIVTPPGATVAANDLNSAAVSSYQFTVTYTDNLAVDISTIGSNDILVTGPNGYSRVASLISVDAIGNGTPRVATYSIPSPGAAWVQADNGVYTITTLAQSVGDTEGAWVAPRDLGQFNVNVPNVIYLATMDTNPGWTFQGLWQYGPPKYTAGNAPATGFTGANIVAYNLSGNYENRLFATYATTPAINCAGASQLTLNFRRWLRLRNSDTASIQVSTNGTTWVDLWSTTGAVSDSSWQDMQYGLPAFTAGNPSVRLRWGIASNSTQNDIGWNIDDVMILGNGSLDTALPAAAINVPNLLDGGSPVHSFTVTYTDNVAVSVASLGAGDLYVLGPNGYSNVVDFAGVDLPTDGTPRTASYDIAAPNGLWTSADNGVYQVYLAAGEVSDTSNNALDEALLGSFTVAIVEIPPTIAGITDTAGIIGLTVGALPDVAYTLETTTDFVTWTELETKIAASATITFSTPDTSDPQRFYRIKR